MVTKKRFFTKNNERVGKKSGKSRGKYRKRGELVKEVIAKPVVKTSNRHELPNIYLNITERILRLRIKLASTVFIAFILIIIGLSVWQTVGILQKSVELAHVVTLRNKLSGEIGLWENIAKDYPNYRDAYFQAAVLSYQLGRVEKGKLYLDKVFAIDPNYAAARELEKLLD